MKLKSLNPAAYIIMILLWSCTEKIDVKLDSSYERLSVYGEVTNIRKTHTIKLSRTADYFSNRPAKGISGARVRIFDNFSEFELTENDTLDGVYETGSSFAGIPGWTYTLLIENVDIDEDGKTETYSAVSLMPPAVQMDSIHLSYLSNSFVSGWQVLLYAQDQGGFKNYYLFKTYKNQILQTDSLSEYVFRNDLLFDGQYTKGVVVQFLNDDDPSERAVEGDRITLELNSINSSYYQFLSEAQNEILPKIPLFSGPPSNVRSNISGNAVGFFTAYAVSRATRIVPSRE